MVVGGLDSAQEAVPLLLPRAVSPTAWFTLVTTTCLNGFRAISLSF